MLTVLLAWETPGTWLLAIRRLAVLAPVLTSLRLLLLLLPVSSLSLLSVLTLAWLLAVTTLSLALA